MKLACICGASNRIPSIPKSRIRCGACKREFTPTDLVKARSETPDQMNPIPEGLEDDLERLGLNDLEDNDAGY